MCGIAGFVVRGGMPQAASAAVLERMTRTLVHRGPDDEGAWIDASAGIALGHRRLSVLDLSQAGHQPMVSDSGRHVIVFNGEIYNHLDLRSRLSVPWRGHSDTETLLAAIEAWGVQEALKRSVGMFAFALWDRQERILTLARDRFGEKPLYYGWQGERSQYAFLFGSELKALRVHPAFRGGINRQALAAQLRYGYVPAPHSIYSGIRKLLPGHILQLRCNVCKPNELPSSQPYWSLTNVIESARACPFEGDEEDAIAELDVVLRDAVRRQMIADVPLGAFLSGGVDSSTVVALMQAQSSRAVKTFTIGFREESHNEAEYASAVGRHLGTEHTELCVSPQTALDLIPRLPELYDEPFADPSQIPTFLVAQLARREVTVSLSGDAGDELFGGYDRYFKALRWWNEVEATPVPVRRCLAWLMAIPPPSIWRRLGRCLAGVSGGRQRWLNLGERIPGLTALLRHDDRASLYLQLISQWLNPEEVIVDAEEPPNEPLKHLSPAGDLVEQMMLVDMTSYLSDNILVKVDRAAMGVSLETRMPFLDHRVVEFALRLPLSTKVRDGRGKWVLRQVLNRYVPSKLTDRPKMGFGVPIGAWLRGALCDWADSLLAESRLAKEGFFRPEPIRRKWAEHLSGQADWQYPLWNVLMFQAWYEEVRRRC